MIVQACINGARPKEFHPALPLTKDAMIADAIECIAAGAAELHIHPRDADGNEGLSHVDKLVGGIRDAFPGSLVGVSTGAWIEGDVDRTKERINQWTRRPDYASVNLSEQDAPAIFALLETKGIGIEAGLATVEDAARFVTLPQRHRVFRVLFEIEMQNVAQAHATLQGIQDILEDACVQRPILLHGFDDTVWHFVRVARDKRWSTRVGLEDGCLLDDQSVASSNARRVAEAFSILHKK